MKDCIWLPEMVSFSVAGFGWPRKSCRQNRFTTTIYYIPTTYLGTKFQPSQQRVLLLWLLVFYCNSGVVELLEIVGTVGTFCLVFFTAAQLRKTPGKMFYT